VTINVTSSDENEGTVSDSSITFDASNWNDVQIVTVTGKDDLLIDGNQIYTIFLDGVTSLDGDYAAINPDDVSVTNIDND